MPEPIGEFEFEGHDEDYPEAWQENAPNGEVRLKAAYRRIRAQHKLVLPDGRISATGSRAWFLPGSFASARAAATTPSALGAILTVSPD
jgi:hypothetical protein